MMEFRKLKDARFGVEFFGIDLRDSVDNDQIRDLTQALYQNHVIIIRNQCLTKENYLEFGEHWGSPIPHVLDHLRMPGYPTLMVIGNTEEKDRVESIRNGTALWHTDQSYEEIPASATMLYAIKVPTIGGETQFCNMVAAYRDLDHRTKREIDSLQVAYNMGGATLVLAETDVDGTYYDSGSTNSQTLIAVKLAF